MFYVQMATNSPRKFAAVEDKEVMDLRHAFQMLSVSIKCGRFCAVLAHF